jgi:hypothetical protein
MPPTMLPIIGHLYTDDQIVKKYKSNEHPNNILLRETYGDK